ncbi:hypothetical protein LguiA_016435 [Lonicera macranthoides]
MSDLIDSKSVSAINRVFQQIGFLSVQMSDKGKLYSSSTYRTAEFSFVRSCLFHGLDPYQEMVHSFNSREVMQSFVFKVEEPCAFRVKQQCLPHLVRRRTTPKQM